jgi:hypothetical protein
MTLKGLTLRYMTTQILALVLTGMILVFIFQLGPEGQARIVDSNAWGLYLDIAGLTFVVFYTIWNIIWYIRGCLHAER